MASLLPASVPFLSGGFATHSPRERVWERIGKEWVIDKSLLDFIFSYLSIFYCVGFSDVGFPVVGLSDDGKANNGKKGKAV